MSVEITLQQSIKEGKKQSYHFPIAIRCSIQTEQVALLRDFDTFDKMEACFSVWLMSDIKNTSEKLFTTN